MKAEYVRNIVVYEDYFKVFRHSLDREALKKLYQVLLLIMTVEVIPVQFLKAIKGKKGLYEIRVEHAGSIYRVFCCFDEGNIVVLFNGFQKKSQKTPIEQIEKAEAIMKQYFKQKEIKNDER